MCGFGLLVCVNLYVLFFMKLVGRVMVINCVGKEDFLFVL